MIKLYQDEFKSLKSGDILEFEVKNPDYKSLVDLAQINYCKMLTPKIIDQQMIVARFQKLNTASSFHLETDDKEKYGVDSTFATIDKNSKASFLHYYLEALKNVKVNSRTKILNLGVNSGEEFDVIKTYTKNFSDLKLIGVDYCPSAIKKAKENFSDENITFLEADINKLEDLGLDRSDLIISIGTLQSSNLEFKPLFQSIVQNHLKKDGAMIIGFPNCRWCDGEMIYGASPKNYNYPEMTVLYNDVQWAKKYLQQKKFRVTITGKDYIFLTATSIRKDEANF